MNVQRVGRGCLERLAGFTESSGVVPDFPWAEAGEAKVRQLPLVLIGGLLPPGDSGWSSLARFTESSGVVSMLFGSKPAAFLTS